MKYWPGWVGFIASVTLFGQTIRVETREVVVDVTVTDSKNVPVQGLGKQDFTLFDDGKPRAIEGFGVSEDQRPISAMPATALHPAVNAAAQSGHSTAIILDEANSFFADAVTARQNVVSLMNQLPADERIALYVIVRGKGLVLVQDYTTDRASVASHLAKQYPGKLRAGGSFRTDQPIPPYDHPPANGEEARMMWRANSDAARLALETLAGQLAQTPGRKSVYWITNAFPSRVMRDLGFDIGWDKTIAALNEANVAVNTVDSRGLYGAVDQATGTVATMQYVSQGTGAETYFGRNDLDGAIAEGIAASRVNYSLRFHLGDDERDHQFHALKVRVDRPGVQLYYRQGYYAGGTEAPVDLVAGKVAGQALEARAAGADVPPLDAAVQLPYFYTGTNRANVHLSADLNRAGLQRQIGIVGIALRPDGSEAARFADTAEVDPEDETHAPWHYEHQFTLASGNYVFRLEVGTGSQVVGRKEMELHVDPWSSGSFGIGGIALSTEARAAGGPAPAGSLIAAGRQFVPAATDQFRKTQRVYFYTEVYDPTLSGSGPSSLTMEVRVLDGTTGEVKQDTGMAGVSGYVHPGSQVVPFATALPVAQLPPGSYRLELRAGHASGTDVVTRAVAFEVN